MANYNSIDDFYKDLEKQTIASLEKTAQEIRRGWMDLIETEIYDSYSPSVYNRQNSLYNSIMISPVKKRNGEYSIDIYASEELHTENPTWRDDWLENTTYSSIFDRFAKDGFYGRGGESIDVTKMTNEEWIENKKATNLILNYLSKWFDIKQIINS